MNHDELIGEPVVSRAALQARLFVVLGVKVLDAREVDDLLADDEVLGLLTDDLLGISDEEVDA